MRGEPYGAVSQIGIERLRVAISFFWLCLALTNIAAMTKLRIVMICLGLALTAGAASAALFGSERKAFEDASRSFSTKLWERAEKEFGEFIAEYPKSERLTEALLLQAQALYQQQKYAEVVMRLEPYLDTAGNSQDQFLYWMAQAEFAAGDYAAAAATFGKLAQTFPTSPHRLEAAVNEAAAVAKLGQWTNVVTLLKRSDGPFRLAAVQAQGGELVSRGYLWLAEAQLKLGDLPGAQVSLNRIGDDLPAELTWQRRYLLCRTLVESGQLEEAVRESEALVQAARGAKSWELVSDSVVFRAELLEQLGRWREAMAAWEMNFTNAPVARQRQALTKATALAIQHEHLAEATQMLEQYLEAFTNSPAADVAWLTLGELHLKQHVKGGTTTNLSGATTNRLAAATNCLQRLLKNFPGSVHLGKAQLNLGWCYWVEDRQADSEAAFAAAVKRLPASADRAVAQFKLADAQFVQNKFADALANYREVLQQMTNWPAVDRGLRTLANYQMLRASLALTNAAAAEEAVRAILTEDVVSQEAVTSILLVAQAYVDAQQPAQAQRWFDEFIQIFPESELRPEVELLAAQLRQEQAQWAQAAAAYDDWLARYPTNRLRAQVEFQRALAAAGLGAETNALQRMTNFISQHPNHGLAPQAQWWVADLYFGREEYASAELNYKQLFQTWPASDLAYEARMMAARAAMGKSGYTDAIEHFKSLTSDTNCPPRLWIQAMSGYGGALMKLPGRTNTESALIVFKRAVERYPTNDLTAAVFGEIGNCALQLADYASASNAYQQAISFPGASAGVRYRAKVGLATVLEKQAAAVSAEEQSRLLKLARDHNLDVYWGKLPELAEPPDVFWRKKAGLEAARLSELLKEWPQAIELYRDMQRQNFLPREQAELKIENAQKQLNWNAGEERAKI